MCQRYSTFSIFRRNSHTMCSERRWEKIMSFTLGVDGGDWRSFLSFSLTRKMSLFASLDPCGYRLPFIFIYFSFSFPLFVFPLSFQRPTLSHHSFYFQGCVGLWSRAEPIVWRVRSHLEEVGGLCDQRRVQFWFGPDVMGVLEEVVTLWGEERGVK